MFMLSQGLFSFPSSAGWEGAQEAGRGHSQDSWLKMTRGILHSIWCHAQYIIWGAGGRGTRSLPRDGWASFSRWWAIALCITCFICSSHSSSIFSSFSVLL